MSTRHEEPENSILDELRKQTAILTKQAKDNRIGMIVAAIFLVGFIATIPFHRQVISRLMPTSHEIDSWHDARTLHSDGKLAEAEEMVQRLCKKYPDYDYGYALLGCWKQELGNLKEAEANYAKAYDLFPSEDNEKTLVAIRKALEKKKPSANQVSEAIAPQGGAQPQR
jgi:tetratricopeptide (TPR) repeat protein